MDWDWVWVMPNWARLYCPLVLMRGRVGVRWAKARSLHLLNSGTIGSVDGSGRTGLYHPTVRTEWV